MEQVKQILQKNKFLILSSILFLSTLILGGLYFQKDVRAEEAFYCPEQKPTNEVIESLSEEETMLQIDVKGAVVNPGVYKIQVGSVVDDVIKLAGGLTTEADTRNLNLSKKLEDEMVIYVYTTAEVNEKILTKSDATIDEELKNEQTIISNKKEESQNEKLVSLNTGTLEELMTLPGIGEAKAKSIIEYRGTCKVFESIEEIKNISGIGEALYQKIKDYITL